MGKSQYSKGRALSDCLFGHGRNLFLVESTNVGLPFEISDEHGDISKKKRAKERMGIALNRRLNFEKKTPNDQRGCE